MDDERVGGVDEERVGGLSSVFHVTIMHGHMLLLFRCDSRVDYHESCNRMVCWFMKSNASCAFSGSTLFETRIKFVYF